jgi:hypothetical protein
VTGDRGPAGSGLVDRAGLVREEVPTGCRVVLAGLGHALADEPLERALPGHRS